MKWECEKWFFLRDVTFFSSHNVFPCTELRMDYCNKVKKSLSFLQTSILLSTQALRTNQKDKEKSSRNIIWIFCANLWKQIPVFYRHPIRENLWSRYREVKLVKVFNIVFFFFILQNAKLRREFSVIVWFTLYSIFYINLKFIVHNVRNVHEVAIIGNILTARFYKRLRSKLYTYVWV